jgi:hypothetical protein
MDLLAVARRPVRHSIFLAVPLAFAISALPCFAQDAAAPAQPAAQPETVQPEPVQSASKPTPPDAARLITPQVIADVKTLLSQPVTVISIGASNDAHADIDQGSIDALDETWKTEAKSEKQPLIAEMLSSPLSNYLLYLQAKSAGLYTEMFVMDDKGLNVGQSSVTSDYWQGDEAKYQKTFQVGPDATFIDEPEYNEDTKTWRVQFDFTIVDPASGKPIGAAAVEMNLTELQRRQALAQGQAL